MKPGEAFNPSHAACGFYPQDVIGRLRWLTDGQKRLYERLVRYAGRNGKYFRSQVTLARELGKTDRQVRKDLKRLEDLALLTHHVRDGRRSNTYHFLWHEAFNGVTEHSLLDGLNATAGPNGYDTARNHGSGQVVVQTQYGYADTPGRTGPE